MARKSETYDQLKEKIEDILQKKSPMLQSDLVGELRNDEWVKRNYKRNSLPGRVSDAIREFKGDRVEVEGGHQPSGSGRSTNMISWIEEDEN